MVQAFCLIVGMSVLTYLGVIKYIVETVGRALAFCIGTSPPEGINAVGNIFLHVVLSFFSRKYIITIINFYKIFILYNFYISVHIEYFEKKDVILLLTWFLYEQTF